MRQGRRLPGSLRRSRCCCALAVVAALVEAAPYGWSAVYLAEHTAATPGTAGLGFTAFVVGMVVARLVADEFVERWGPVTVVRIGP